MKALYSEIDSSYAYFDWSTKLKFVQKGTQTQEVEMWALLDLLQYLKTKRMVYSSSSGKNLFVSILCPSFSTVQKFTNARISFQLNGWTIAPDARTDVNTTFTENRKLDKFNRGGATIYASQLSKHPIE